MDVANSEDKSVNKSVNHTKNVSRNLIYPALLMVILGAFYWAIQGTGGYGGAPGGAYAGLGFGTLWLYFSRKTKENSIRPYHSGWVLFAIVAGLSLGGTVGFGIYGGWIQNQFHYTIQRDFLPMSESFRGWIGYFMTGFQWGGFTGIFIAYTHSNNRLPLKKWIIRIIFGVLGGLAGYLLVTQLPSLFFPFYNEGIYSGVTLSEMILRVIETIEDIGVYVGIFLGLLLYEIIRKEWKTVLLSVTMAVLIGIALSLNAYWFIIGAQSSLQIDWWKMWEMSNGCWIGATFALCNYLYNKPISVKKDGNLQSKPNQKHQNRRFLLEFHIPYWITVNFVTIAAFDGFYQDRNMKLIFVVLPVVLIFILSTVYSLQMIRGGGNSKMKIPYFSTQLFLAALGFFVSHPGENAGGFTIPHRILLVTYAILIVLATGVFFGIVKRR